MKIGRNLNKAIERDGTSDTRQGEMGRAMLLPNQTYRQVVRSASRQVGNSVKLANWRVMKRNERAVRT
ncbi:hypothetical protein M2350_003450 [Candidatus Fervidibacter sacchari]|uniref:Uncharacterized protein n=1 Tax=Candidatus Fervidibacter sacchari TaxID=1448929 RepID=A0ABT2ETN7_9BACT|nr:hypothetical protein [Candidatus Fervidibacter sacchari]